jgi:hypothetical protein
MNRPRYIVVQSCPTDQQRDFYIIDLVKSACVDRVSGGFAQVTDRVARMNREAG